MIIQWIIDFLRDVIVNWIRGVPHPPQALWDLRGWLVTTGYELNQLVSNFGVVIPFNGFSAMIATWLTLVAFWGTMLVVRVVLWALGR